MSRNSLRVLANKVRALRESRHWSQENLAMEAGVSRSWVKELEAARFKSPGAAKLLAVAQALDAKAEEFLGLAGVQIESKPDSGANPRLTYEQLLDELRMISPVPIPVVEVPAHAGHRGTPIINYIYAERPGAVNRELLCVAVRGDCMAPLIASGDLVIIDRGAWPEQGQIVVAVVAEEVLIRRFYKLDDHIALRPDNKDFGEIQAQEMDIVGVVVEIRKRT